MSRRGVAVLAVVATGLGTVAVAGADTGGRPLSATLTGRAEAPGPGDPDGSGSALIRLNQGQRRVCFELDWRKIERPTAAHIHEAPPGDPGPVVVGLFDPSTGPLRGGCIENVDRALIKDIRQSPGDYYVNIHTPSFLGGAIRGQLHK